MKTMVLRILIISIVFFASGCSGIVSQTEQHSQVLDSQATTITPTRLPTFTGKAPSKNLPTETPTATPRWKHATSTPTLTPTPSILFSVDTLQCSTYIETSWGSESGQFGYDFDGHLLRNPNGPYPIQFDEMGNMYVSDHVNNRILVYPKGDKTPQEIALPSNYQYDCVGANEKQTISWYNISIAKDKIYLVFQDANDGKYKIGVLTTEGEEKQIVDLSAYISQPPLYQKPAVADGSGGVYVNVFVDTPEIVHFNDEFIPDLFLNINEVSWSFHNMVVGWDSNLYTFETDILEMWGKAETAFANGLEPEAYIDEIVASLPTGELGETDDIAGMLIGVDLLGNVYMKLFGNQGHISVARFHFETRNGTVSRINVPGYISVSPDGTLYVLSFDRDDPDIPPKILKCLFTYDLQ